VYLRKRLASIASILSISILLGCDPQQVVVHYFSGQGLNPLAVVRNDVMPGALILKQEHNTLFAESIWDYSTGPKPTITSRELTSAELDAVMKKYEQDREVSAVAAANFLKSVLPTKITTDLGLTDKVKIDLPSVKTSRLKPMDIQTYLAKGSGGLRNFIATQHGGSEPYVVYETYYADTLSISAETGTDVSTKVEVSSEFRPLSSEDRSFSYKRPSKETILIMGDKPCVFAVRAGKLLIRNGVYAFEFTNFVTGNVKATGGDEQYSAPVLADYSPISLQPVKSLF
jgi:hypothetical protein